MPAELLTQQNGVCAQAVFKTACIESYLYLPTFANNNNYEDDILNCFAFVDSVLDDCLIPGVTQIVLLGDRNFDAVRLECCERLSIVRSFLYEYGLIICDYLDCINLVILIVMIVLIVRL